MPYLPDRDRRLPSGQSKRDLSEGLSTRSKTSSTIHSRHQPFLRYRRRRQTNLVVRRGLPLGNRSVRTGFLMFRESRNTVAYHQVFLSFIQNHLPYRSKGKARPLVRDYQTIPNSDNIQVRIPSKSRLPSSNQPPVY